MFEDGVANQLAADFRHNHERIGFALADAELPQCRAGHGT